PGIGVQLVPELDQGELLVSLEAAPGTSLGRMEALTRAAEEAALATGGVREVISTVGVRGGGGTLGGGGEEERHAATMLVRLAGLETDENAVAETLAGRLETLPGIA